MSSELDRATGELEYWQSQPEFVIGLAATVPARLAVPLVDALTGIRDIGAALRGRAILARRFPSLVSQYRAKWLRDAESIGDPVARAYTLADLAGVAGESRTRIAAQAIRACLDAEPWAQAEIFAYLARWLPASALAGLAASTGNLTAYELMGLLRALRQRAAEVDAASKKQLRAELARVDQSPLHVPLMAAGVWLDDRANSRRSTIRLVLDGLREDFPDIDALADVAPYLTDAEISEVLRTVGLRKDSHRDAQVLRAIAAALHGERLELAIEIGFSATDAAEAVRRIATIVAQFDHAEATQVAARIRRLPDQEARQSGLAAIVSHLSVADIRQFWLSARASGSADDWAKAIREMAMPGALTNAAKRTVAAIKSDRARIEAAAALARDDKRLRSWAVDLWLNAPIETRVGTSSSIAPLVTPHESEKMLLALEGSGDASGALRARTELLRRVPSAELRRWLERAASRGRGLDWAAAASYLPLTKSAARSVAGIFMRAEIDARIRTLALSRIARYLSRGIYDDVFVAAFPAGLDDLGEDVIIEAIRGFASTAQPGQAAAMWQIAQRVLDKEFAAEAVSGLVDRLPQALRQEAQRFVDEHFGGFAGGGGDLEGATSVDEMVETIESLQPPTRDRLLDSAVRKLRRHAGAHRVGSRRVQAHDVPSVADGPVPGWERDFSPFGRTRFALSKPQLIFGQQPTPLALEEPTGRPVTVGISSVDQTHIALDGRHPLEPDHEYYLWLELADVAGGLDAVPASLPKIDEAADDELIAVLFRQDFGQEPLVGRLGLLSAGGAEVIAQPQGAPTDGRSGRLYFRFATGESASLRMRLNIYHSGTLIQGRVITATVGAPRLRDRQLESQVDFEISPSLSSTAVQAAGSHGVSLFLNQSRSGTHSLYIAAADNAAKPLKREVRFDPGQLSALIAEVRIGLRMAAWGDPNEWNGQPYLYAGAIGRKQFHNDLVLMANRGWAFYDEIVDELGGPEAIEESLTRSTRIEVAIKKAPRWILPASLVYDYPIDTGLLDPADYIMCPEFEAAIERDDSLENAHCFLGSCPSRDKLDRVCPSGFWGFRHAISFPVSMNVEPAGTIDYHVALDMAACVSTDAKLDWPGHKLELAVLAPPAEMHQADERSSALTLLGATEPHLVYFYCHGGVEGRRPYLVVGDSKSGPIFSDVLRSRRIKWPTTRPLVVLNGCRTAAVSPESIHTLVAAFLNTALAGGVVGTDITVFEPLARTFGVQFLTRFVNGWPLDKAVRGARLALLRERNPLGLAYVPYGLGTLQIGQA